MKAFSAALLAATGLLCLGTDSLASTITVTLSFQGEGSIGATPFSWTTLTITAVGDTLNRVAISGPDWAGYSLDLASSTISIPGMGNYVFTWPTGIQVYNANLSSDTAFVFATSYVPNGTPEAGQVFIGKYLVFTTWDMLSSLAPMTATDTVLDNSDWAFVLRSGSTTAEMLRYDSASIAWPAVTIQATVSADPVPEPRLSQLVVLGLVGLGVFAYRRKKGPVPAEKDQAQGKNC